MDIQTMWCNGVQQVYPFCLPLGQNFLKISPSIVGSTLSIPQMRNPLGSELCFILKCFAMGLRCQMSLSSFAAKMQRTCSLILPPELSGSEATGTQRKIDNPLCRTGNGGCNTVFLRFCRIPIGLRISPY